MEFIGFPSPGDGARRSRDCVSLFKSNSNKYDIGDSKTEFPRNKTNDTVTEPGSGSHAMRAMTSLRCVCTRESGNTTARSGLAIRGRIDCAQEDS
ncbi:hypothetical protein EVAR_70132_1 [Eumeta japonica]|uniref:Uncharacterized protein n=1 Tax=Eumeta variegata TaxID=151549 RepID=A0A4C1Z846_EUMVA|nr:hypothetical protein EVAR_70132_1 [Eumeta japonica]